MDSGVIAFVPIMFIGGVAISLALGLLAQWRRRVPVLLGALLPPSLLMTIDAVVSDSAYAPDAETVLATVSIWTVALIPALIGSLCGAFVATQAKRRDEY